jgi:hypothetical protein
VPAVEARVIQIILWWDARGMESLMMRVLQTNIAQTFVLSDGPVANDLDLWLMGDGLQIWVQDAALCIEGLAMPV